MTQSLTRLQASVAAAFGKVAGYIKGLRGVFRELAAQHREVRSVLTRLQAGPSGEVRQVLWAEAREKLLAHERAELEVVYSFIASFPTTAQLAERHAHCASELERAVHELDSLAFDAPEYSARLRALLAQLDKHVQEEEGEYFVRAQAHIGQERAAGLVGAYERAYQRQLDQLRFSGVFEIDDEAPTLRRGASLSTSP